MAKGQDFCRFLMSAYHLGTVDSIISSHRRDCRMNACSWAFMRQLRTANKAGSSSWSCRWFEVQERHLASSEVGRIVWPLCDAVKATFEAIVRVVPLVITAVLAPLGDQQVDRR